MIRLLVVFYKNLTAPFGIHACRFTPTCSEYLADAVEKKGFLKGFWFFLRRILRCQPLSSGGWDPVS